MTDDRPVFEVAGQVALQALWDFVRSLPHGERLPEVFPHLSRGGSDDNPKEPSLHELLRGAGLEEPTVEEMRTMKAALQLFGFDPSDIDRAYGKDRPDNQPAETGEEGIPSLAALRATQRARRRNCRRVVLALRSSQKTRAHPGVSPRIHPSSRLNAGLADGLPSKPMHLLFY